MTIYEPFVSGFFATIGAAIALCMFLFFYGCFKGTSKSPRNSTLNMTGTLQLGESEEDFTELFKEYIEAIKQNTEAIRSGRVEIVE